MNTSTDEPDEKQRPILDEGIRKHLGKGLRVMYEQEAPILPNDTIDYKIDRMESGEGEIERTRDKITSRLVQASEHPFIANCQAFIALVQLIRTNRVAGFQVLSYALMEFGRTIERWGGWPHVSGAPEGAAAARFWYSLTAMGRPKDEAGWERFLTTAGAFAFALMVQNEKNPAFWHKLSGIAHGPFRRAVDAYRRSL